MDAHRSPTLPAPTKLQWITRVNFVYSACGSAQQRVFWVGPDYLAAFSEPHAVKNAPQWGLVRRWSLYESQTEDGSKKGIGGGWAKTSLRAAETGWRTSSCCFTQDVLGCSADSNHQAKSAATYLHEKEWCGLFPSLSNVQLWPRFFFFSFF